jgi:hypothetical protein
MVARRPLCLVSGLVSELPSGDVASAGSSAIEFVAGTGLYGGGFISQLPRYDVKVAPQASGVIFVGNNLALDGSALATATDAAVSGFPAAVSASNALASGNAALDISIQALASGTDALEIVAPLAGGGTRLTFTAATTVPAGVPVGLNDAGQIEPIRAPYWCTPVISGIYVPSGVGGSGVIASGTQFWIQPTGVITPGTQAIRLGYYMLNYDFDIKYCTDYDDFIVTYPSQPTPAQLTQILKPGPGGYLYATNNPRRHLGNSYYFYWSRLDECRDIKRYLIGGTYSANYYPYIQDFGRDNDNLFVNSIGVVTESVASYYYDMCYLSNGLFIVTYSNSSYILKVRAGYISTYSTPSFAPVAEQIVPASVYEITTVKHKDPNKAVCFYNKSDEGKTYACLLTVNTENLNVDVSFPIAIINTSGLELQAKYIETDDSYVLIATVSSKVRIYKIKEVSTAVFQVVSDLEVGGFYGYNNSIDYDPTSQTIGFITNDYYTSMVAGYTQPSGDYLTPVQSGRLNLDRYNGNCRSQFHRGTGQYYGLHYMYYQLGLRCTPIAAPFSDFPALPHANKTSNFIGIASDNVASGQNCTVVMPGEVYTQPSGNLYAGQPVYLDIMNSGVTQNPLKPASWSGQVEWGSIGVAVNSSGYTLRNLL